MVYAGLAANLVRPFPAFGSLLCGVVLAALRQQALLSVNSCVGPMPLLCGPMLVPTSNIKIPLRKSNVKVSHAPCWPFNPDKKKTRSNNNKQKQGKCQLKDEKIRYSWNNKITIERFCWRQILLCPKHVVLPVKHSTNALGRGLLWFPVFHFSSQFVPYKLSTQFFIFTFYETFLFLRLSKFELFPRGYKNIFIHVWAAFLKCILFSRK